jgi:hypothetical protein
MKPPITNMKKLLFSLTMTLLYAGAFGQGKLAFDNSDDYGSGVWTHLIYFTTNPGYLALPDRTATANGTGMTLPIAGSGLYTGPGSTVAALSGSPTIIAALYGGTSSNSLTLQTTTTIDDVNNEGCVVRVNCTFASLPAGTPAWFQIQVFDSRANPNAPGGGAADAWSWGAHPGWYAGASQVFQATPTSAIFSPIWQTTPPVNSTWADGTFELVDMTAAYGPGYYGAIEVYTHDEIPEPPHIGSSQPQSTTNYWGQSATFTVIAGGFPMPSYQWQVNGTNLYDGPRVTTSATRYNANPNWLYQLTLNPITLADAGSYRLFISNWWDTALSDTATLTVVLIPPSITNVIPQPDGSVTLNLTGTPYSTNRLWATADLTPPVVWSPVSTNVADSAGTWQVTDTEAIGWTNRFYRTSMP